MKTLPQALQASLMQDEIIVCFLNLQHECCNHGHTDIAALLLDHGALINAPGYDDDTPLHDAVANGHFDIASLLISRGANPRLRYVHMCMLILCLHCTRLVVHVLCMSWGRIVHAQFLFNTQTQNVSYK